MSAERLEEENARLVRRERLDLMPTKVLGLFVVGSLARRWGVGVTLSRTPGGGVTSQVAIPSALLLMMSPLIPSPAPAVSRAPVDPAGREIPAPTRAPEPTRAPALAPEPEPVVARAAVAETRAVEVSAAVPAGDVRRPGAGPVAGDADSPLSREGGLPRRIPRHQDGPAGAAVTTAPASVAPAVTEPAVGRPEHDEGREDAQGRPLRRRVRGATLRTTLSAANQQSAVTAPRLADADEVRSELDEFDAAVERAHRDSVRAADSRTTTDVPGFAEGAEQ
jgi:hypothetical protein